MGSSPDINYPAQPSYGEGMADAMKAQMEQLLGQGEYAQMYADAGFAGGNLGDIIAGVEAPIRQKTAQVDTDVLRQTLLGSEKKFQVEKDPDTGKYGITGAEVVKGEDGEPQTAGDGRYDLVFLKPGSKYQKNVNDKFFQGTGNWLAIAPTYGIVDTKTGGITKVGGDSKEWRYYQSEQAGEWFGKQTNEIPTTAINKIQSLRTAITDADGDADAAAKEFQFENPYTGEPLEEGQTVTIREGDGMIDLLGDKRNVQEVQQADDFEAYVDNNPDVLADYFRKKRQGRADSKADFGEQHYLTFGKEEGRELTQKTTLADTGRQAGFDAEGNFLGLSALAEDIQRGNLSRQRESDLADVERLSDRFQTVMEDYKPASTTGIQGARDLLEEQKEAMTTGKNAVTAPSDSTYGGDIAGQTMTAATVADPLQLSASTSYNPSASVSGGTFDANTSYNATSVADPMKLTAATSYNPSAGVKGEGYTATANLQGGNIGQDAFRQALMAQATNALDNGLSDRELANISNAARARSTMMGRTFDQQGAIDESKALVLEDQKRLMENRAFAQQALGQETDIRERDLGRGLQASMQNQAALNRAAEFGASQNMQAQLANQAATNQALSQGLTAGLSQEALAAQQAQAKAMADATATNRASEFGVAAGMQQQAQANQAGLQAQLANQSATNQAAQFGVGAGMQQQTQQAQLNQANALAQAQMDQQANAFGADAAMRAATLNQGQQQQANQFGVGATMDAQRLNEQLRQQGLGNYINAVGNLSQIEEQTTLDPFAALLGRASGGSLQAGQGVFGQAGYGLQSGPQYLNPEAGLGYISNMAANEANMYAAQLSADATRDAGMMSMFGSLGGGFLGNKGLFGG
ncbi:hypothetical protein OAN13_08190 [Opitutales bacterium]|nr:hypothetical protein [Opitutales bacterium]